MKYSVVITYVDNFETSRITAKPRASPMDDLDKWLNSQPSLLSGSDDESEYFGSATASVEIDCQVSVPHLEKSPAKVQVYVWYKTDSQ